MFFCMNADLLSYECDLFPFRSRERPKFIPEMIVCPWETRKSEIFPFWSNHRNTQRLSSGALVLL